MAHRLKACAAPDGEVLLSAEDENAIGDFSLMIAGSVIACECSRLTFGPAEEEQFKIWNLVYDYIADLAKSKPSKRLLVRLKKAINQFDRTLKQACAKDLTIDIQVQALSSDSERISFELVDGR